MESIKAVFWKPDPKEQARKCNSLIRANTRKLDREIQQLRAVEAKTRSLILAADRRASRNPSQARQASRETRLFARELVRARRATARLVTSRAQLQSVGMQVGEALAARRIEGSVRASTGIMRDVNGLLRLPELAGTMRELSMELVKAGVIEEMVGDVLPGQLDDADGELAADEEAEDEVERVLGEVLRDRMGRAGAAPAQPPQLEQASTPAAEEESEEELEQMRDRLEALKS